MNKTLKEYLSEIGRKGGKKSKRAWTPEQKERMVKKLMDTLKEKRVPVRRRHLMCQNCDDPEQYEAKHGPSRRDRLRNDPDYGDWLYEQQKDKEMEKEMDKEEKCG